MFARLKNNFFKGFCVVLRMVGILVVLTRKKILIFFFGLELKTFAALLLVFFYSDNSFKNSRVYYFVVNVLATLGFLWGSILGSKFIFLLGLFLKLSFFPFLWWFPYICESLKYWCFFFLKIVQKIVPIVLSYTNKIVSHEFIYLLVGVSYFLSLLKLHYNQNNIKLFLVWSSSGKLCIILLLIKFSWGSALLYFFVYSFVLGLFIFVLNKARITYWRDFVFSGVSLLYVAFFCLFNFMGFPPLLGFFIKVIFFLSFVYISWLSFFGSMAVLMFILILFFLNMIVYVKLATKLMLVKVVVHGGVLFVLVSFLIFSMFLRLVFVFV